MIWGIIYAQPKSLSRIPRLARQDLAAGFAGALPGLRLAPHIVKHTRGATQTSAHVENHTTHKEEGKTTTPMGAAAEGRRPHRYGCWRERSERPPSSLCVVWFST